MGCDKQGLPSPRVRRIPTHPCLMSQSICITKVWEPFSYSSRRLVMGTSCEMSGRFSTGSPSPGKVCPLINAVLHVCIEQTYLDTVEQPSRPEFCDVRGRATRNQQRPLSRSHVRHPTHLQDRQWPYCLPTAVRAGTTETRPHLADRPPLASLHHNASAGIHCSPIRPTSAEL